MERWRAAQSSFYNETLEDLNANHKASWDVKTYP